MHVPFRFQKTWKMTCACPKCVLRKELYKLQGMHPLQQLKASVRVTGVFIQPYSRNGVEIDQDNVKNRKGISRIWAEVAEGRGKAKIFEFEIILLNL